MSTTSVFIFLTRSCNLACSHCYVSAEPRLKNRMSLPVFRKTVDFLAAEGFDDVRLTGGEPTIHPDFEQMLDLLSNRDIVPRLITNGISLMKMRSPGEILDKISRCWISVYGISPQQHREVGGRGSQPLEAVLDFVGRQNRAGHWVGVSALLTEVSWNALGNFIASARQLGVRYLRFLFAEPSGRALESNSIFGDRIQSRDQAVEVVEYLERTMADLDFEFLSINNPFDLDGKHGSGQTSCLLADRRMWSISPEGDIYSCCFNIYDPIHKVSSALDNPDLAAIRSEDVAKVYAPKCKALGPTFWGAGSEKPTCPISALTLSRIR